eukprot:jgi/Phyca11/5778/fgenesh1_pm.PHYCAscaffold_8_\
MISNEKYRSGASWEYVAQSLEPGLAECTSLSHPFGGAPTYALTNYVAGIRSVEFGFRRWILNPLVTGLEITRANATLNATIYKQNINGTGESISFTVQL